MNMVRWPTAIEQVADALAIVSFCHEQDAQAVLLDESVLPPAFFDLKTQFAGEFIQKLLNYRITVAGVFAQPDRYSQRFGEYLAEARHGRQFRVFDSAKDASAWLRS